MANTPRSPRTSAKKQRQHQALQESPGTSVETETEMETSPAEASGPTPKMAAARRRRLLIGLIVFLLLVLVGVAVGIIVSSMSSGSSSQRENQDGLGNDNSNSGEPPSSATPEGSTPSSPTDGSGSLTTAPETPITDGSGVPSETTGFVPNSAPTTSPEASLTFSTAPSGEASATPSLAAVAIPPGITTFRVIGDVPYTPRQARELVVQMNAIPLDTEFIVHVGDIRNGGDKLVCYLSEYESVDEILSLSPVPLFLIMGDNEWNDCPNVDEGLTMWNNLFTAYESKYWTHNFNITRLAGWESTTFAFLNKGTLFIGLNLVGGRVVNRSAWDRRLADQASWTIGLIREHMVPTVIFGHAFPTENHDPFFYPMTEFIRDELQNSLPIVYMNGDKHQWLYEPSFYGQTSWTRIMVTGGSREPPLKMVVDPNNLANFHTFDREL
ncbi:predicted protein [Phaeodactylum tricornutum CCAP 1055/1]|uniref:Calcineurin-like phosphoesterase domain-containing protein n=1 Tax=Phaeodactylum tricornutum (strain CCAP 1055/1) TaxID=556484 RepID=B7FXW9_PHATC|nr:predicted protein [Phaeodactylum tricornutum CCAP 1055/1]EEC48618.1 predicted protein [Phaeodactylum tricornutum CCAP 1055/1]|eukprot:XP_002179632.1 predicted protein [Phaeodactylum tricornutum CCAP 1055/1]